MSAGAFHAAGDLVLPLVNKNQGTLKRVYALSEGVDSSSGRSREWHACESLPISKSMHRYSHSCVVETQKRRFPMIDAARIKEHAEVIGADGAHVGTVDRVEGSRIKLTKKDSGEGGHRGHHHFIPLELVADIEGDKVRLSADGDVAVTFEEEEGGKAVH
jgi:hypothetical protein